MENPLGESEKSCAAHARFRCRECYPGKFVSPVFLVTGTDAEDDDPKPRFGLTIRTTEGQSIYIPSSQVKTLGLLLCLAGGFKTKIDPLI